MMLRIYTIAITAEILAIGTYMLISYLIQKLTGNWDEYK